MSGTGSSRLERKLNSVVCISEIQREFNNINENTLLLISALDTKELKTVSDEALSKIKENFSDMDKLSQEYKDVHIGNFGQDDALRRRFSHAEYAISAYRRKIDEVNDNGLTAVSHEEGVSIYEQELAPLQMTAGEMLDAVAEIAEKNGQEQVEIANNVRRTATIITFGVIILTVISLYFIAKAQIDAIIEIRRKEQEITEAGNRLTKSRKKLMDSAMTNILTGMKNRYALDESLSQLIGNAQFNIAVLDIDNFRLINDNYGYELGDEYLATIAERLKTDYSNFADMFNITGNEFCLVFYEHVSDLQAQQLAEQIRQAIGQQTMVAGIPIQATVSASLYHYLPSDNLDVNTLLMKMDSALHAAKRDGGNRMYQIQ